MFTYFESEIGKHVIQRIPSNEKNGRSQTSVVVVGVLPIKEKANYKKLEDKDLKIDTMKGSGPGGQHLQKTESCIRATHIPTGLNVRVNGRDQHSNKREALEILTVKVNEYYFSQKEEKYNDIRKAQLADQGRSNKIRTYNIIGSRIVDHRTNKKIKNVKAVLEKGQFDLLRN